jgi:hypothetical protein
MVTTSRISAINPSTLPFWLSIKPSPTVSTITAINTKNANTFFICFLHVVCCRIAA